MKTLTVSRDPHGVARVTMARPEAFGALDEMMVSELDTTFAELGADDSVRVIVLTGEGKAFSAGADLEWMKRASGTSVEWSRKDVRRLADMLWRVDTIGRMRATDEAREGLDAFLEKRHAHWTKAVQP